MNQVLRQEHKYLLSLWESRACIDRLRRVMAQDSHNGEQGYLVRSLYFDTLDDQDFFDKQNGLDARKKLRLRIYDPQQDFAMLEMKQKQGDEQKKRSLRVKAQDARLLCDGNYSPLLQYADAFAVECYAVMTTACYQPKAVVQYHRFAFVGQESKVRITLDSEIRATESATDLFSSTLAMNPVFHGGQAVLEVKYSGFLPSYLKELVSFADRSKLAVSKYCLSRSLSQWL